MKRLHILDKISLWIIAFNIISAIVIMRPGPTITAILAVFAFYGMFLMWLSIPAGIILNIVSIVKKKNIKTAWINVLMIIIFVLNVPLLRQFIAIAVSV